MALLRSLSWALPKPTSFYPMTSQRRHKSFNSYLVTPKQLADSLVRNAPTKISTAPRVIPLCAAWFLPNDPAQRTGLQVFEQRRIPSARFFDLDRVIDHESPYPHMLPTAEVFAQNMRDLGIRRDDEIVVYDTQELGIFSAPRVGWTLQIFGHPNVHVLNNFRLWIEEGYPTESGEIKAVEEDKTDYPVPIMDPGKAIKFAEMKDIVQDHGKEGAEKIQVLDARPYGRWAGKDPEPRPGMPNGHIPRSISVPFSDLLDPQTKAILPGDALQELFKSKGINQERPIISSCGTGVTAAVLDAALSEANYGHARDRRLYDGSWTEWAQRATEAEGLIKKMSA